MKESPAICRKIDSGPPATHRLQRGIALVVVLIFLVLLTVLVLAFFSSVTNEYTASKTYANEVSTNFLSDSAVNIVMGQIAKGTSGTLNGTTRLAWASQPGMIRTWDDTGRAEDCYKLYSSGSMVITGSVVQSGSGAVLNALQADVPTAWSSQPAIYTDLNAPVTDSSGAVNFPIIDGNGMNTVSVSGSSVLTYWHQPVGKPRTPNIEGFYVQPSYVPGFNTSGSLSGTNTPVPMPVAWLYVLKDGTIISPDPGGSGTIATFTSGTIQPSAANPIVGRVAFWTDDETCKLNINTASEGVYFASPHTDSNMDMMSTTKPEMGFGMSPPASGTISVVGDYNRWPGHPANTCLSVALGTWMNEGSGTVAPNAYTTTANDQNYLTGLTNLFTILPRSPFGGSYAGTISGTDPSYGTYNSGTSINRLFASFDELMFNPLRQANPTATGTFTKTELEELKFFLTASSRAPELTPFNTPKVSLWPQNSGTYDRANYPSPTSALGVAEKLLAFCSSFGAAGVNPTSPSKQFEYFVQRYSYSNPSCMSSTQDWIDVPRNQQLATYLCNLGNRNIPGYGAAFRSPGKYSDLSFSDIVLKCLDYIRSDVHRYDANSPDQGPVNANYICPLVVTGSTNNNAFPGLSGTMAIKGFGYGEIYPQFVLGETTSDGTTPNPFIAVYGFNPAMSYPGGNHTSIAATFTNLSNLGLVNADGSAISGSVTIGADSWYTNGYYSAYNKPNPMRAFVFNLAGYKFSGTATIGTGTQQQTTVQMGGPSPVTISFLDSDPAGNPTAYINYSLQFPLTPPLPAPTGVFPSQAQQAAASLFTTSNGCIARGMECFAAGPTGGDYRLLGGLVNPPSGYFGQSQGYSGTNAQAHSLYIYCGSDTQPIFLNGTYGPPTSWIVGSLVSTLANTDYEDHEAPYAPVGLKAALNYLQKPGDWDTGPNVYPDGPYLNPVEQSNPFTIYGYYYWYGGNGGAGSGQYGGGGSGATSTLAFSPNRQIASAVQFGSIPTGVCAVPPQPWQTLLFCPNPAARSTSASTSGTSTDHIGFANPPDHVFLNFFTMPVVEPYAISEPLSTAGKVNLNYQLAPFTNIERSTALRGVLKNTMVTGISGYDVKSTTPSQHPTSDFNNPMYKGDCTGDGRCNVRYPYEMRYDINRDATIAGIEEHYFNQGQIFRYPSEVCDVFLVPQYLTDSTGSPNRNLYNPNNAPVPTSYDNMLGWWSPTGSSPDPLAVMNMTGDNLREEPYNHIYPRLTTQSNTYTVHCRVQTLKKRTGSNQAEWDEGLDVVTAEYRGSSLIERYIDPADPALNSSWDNDTINMNLSGTNHADLSSLYKFRVISKKKFAP